MWTLHVCAIILTIFLLGAALYVRATTLCFEDGSCKYGMSAAAAAAYYQSSGKYYGSIGGVR